MSTRAKIIAIGAVLGALVSLHYIDKHYALEEVKAKYERERKELATRTERATQALEASSVQKLKERDEKINRISADLDVALERLRHRPSRSTKAPGATPSCKGSELYREDAEFLTREAARAERVMEERNFYYERYEETRIKLKELNGTRTD